MNKNSQTIESEVNSKNPNDQMEEDYSESTFEEYIDDETK